MNKFFFLFCSFILIISLTACSQDKSKETAGTPQTTQQQPETAAAPPSGGAPVTGKVLETMDAGGYTYMNLETAAGPKWVAINQTPVQVGEEVTYIDGMVMQNFTSKALDRTFPEVVFSGGLIGKGAPTPGTEAQGEGGQSFSQALTSEGSAPTTIPGGMETGSKKAIVPLAEIKVEKAPGDNSYTVEEIFSKGAELNGKPVVVRGKVMKVSPRIMGRNWIHIQDGTGNPDKNTHDLVVTTTDDVAGDTEIVIVEGTLASNKDFGAGYTYVVIIEDAKVKE